MPNITIVANMDKTLYHNQAVQLSLVNDNADENAVAAMLDGVQVGWVAASPDTIIKGTFSAEEVRMKWLGNPTCAGITAVLRRSVPFTNKLGNTQQRWKAECFLIPARQEGQEAETVEIQVGGTAVRHSKKYGVLELLKNGNADSTHLLLGTRADPSGNQVYCTYFPDDDIANSAGEISNLPDEMKALLARGEKVTTSIVRPAGNSGYIIAVRKGGDNLAPYYQAIDDTARRGIAKTSVLEKRVKHMISAGFSEKQIMGVLEQTPMYDAERASIPDPKTPYIQANGSNLSDAVGYIRRGKLVQLKGEKGSGKNTLIETACWLLGRPLCRVQGNDDISKMDFEGSRTLKDGSTDFELSEMFRTLQVGGIVVVDEVNMIRPNVLADLHSLTDGSRSINVTGYGLVKMDPHACIVYTRNEGYVGTSEMNPATVDRGPVIVVRPETNLAQLLAHAVPTASEGDIKICCKVAEAIQKSVKSDSSLTPDAVTIRGYIDALECADDIPLKRGLLHNVAYKLPEGPESDAIEAIILANCK